MKHGKLLLKNNYLTFKIYSLTGRTMTLFQTRKKYIRQGGMVK
jgi:hypothetical protein